MHEGICVCLCVWDVHQGEGHELKQTKHSWIILLKRLPVFVIYTFSTCCFCTSVPAACSWDKQTLLPLSLSDSPVVSQSHNAVTCTYCHLSKRVHTYSSHAEELHITPLQPLHTCDSEKGVCTNTHNRMHSWCTSCTLSVAKGSYIFWCICRKYQYTISEFPLCLSISKWRSCKTLHWYYTHTVTGLWCGTWSALLPVQVQRVWGRATGILWLFFKIYFDFIIVMVGYIVIRY